MTDKRLIDQLDEISDHLHNEKGFWKYTIHSDPKLANTYVREISVAEQSVNELKMCIGTKNSISKVLWCLKRNFLSVIIDALRFRDKNCLRERYKDDVRCLVKKILMNVIVSIDKRCNKPKDRVWNDFFNKQKEMVNAMQTKWIY